MVCPMPPQERQPHRRLRALIERFALLAVAVLVIQAWFVQGFPVLCQVRGGSMAETLLGSHYQVACADCGAPFVCDAECPPAGGAAVCPNCGYAGNELDAHPALSGDRLLIDRTAFAFRAPRRWEVIAFRGPAQNGTLAVKRVVGLPRETVEVRQGDVYSDGQIQRKPLLVQRTMRVLVHDAAFRPTREPAPPPRWRGTGDSGWRWADGRFARPVTAEQDAVDWLVYQHSRRRPGHPGETVPSPVTDLCGYNQGRPRREEDVHPTADVMLSLRVVETIGRGLLWLRATDGIDEFQTWIDPGRQQYAVLRNGRPVPAGAGRLASNLDGTVVEVSLIDQQFLLAFDGHAVVTCPYDRIGANIPPPAEPLAVGSQGLGVVLEDLRVYRDVYYTTPVRTANGRNSHGPVRLGVNEYYVLGDNSPISADSRTWPEGPAISGKWLLGKPLAIVFPAREAEQGGRRFQVPDPARIRYIR